MTCIVGVMCDGVCVIGADTLAVSGLDKMDRRDGKVFTKGDFAIGFSTSYRVGQILRYHWVPPARLQSDGDDYAYMVASVVPSMIEVLSNYGFAKVKDCEVLGGDMIVGYLSELYFIKSDFEVGQSCSGLLSVGSGAPYALGAMHAQRKHSQNDAREIANAGLSAAAKWDAGVGGEFQMVEYRAKETP